jgi:hypothetical protein
LGVVDVPFIDDVSQTPMKETISVIPTMDVYNTCLLFLVDNAAVSKKLQKEYQNVEETYLLPVNSNIYSMAKEECTSNIESSNKNDTIPGIPEEHTSTIERCTIIVIG